MRSVLPIFALGILASGLTPRPGLAATASASFGVSATVQATCQATASAMAFKTFASTVVSSTSPVSVTCNNTAHYNVDLSAGMGIGSVGAMPEMRGSGTRMLGDGLSSLPRGIVNRNVTAVTDLAIGTGNRSAKVFAEQSQMPAQMLEGRYIAVDASFDTIIVTVTY